MYRGRFAPSPTGALHIGSLVCALASFLDARAAGGRWLVRIEDLDPPREKPGAAADILRTLEQHGLCWDEEVVYQGRRQALYEEALARLVAGGQAFRCSLSRAQLDDLGEQHPGRAQSESRFDAAQGYAWRFDTPDEAVHFSDRVQGPQTFHPAREGGPFVLRRRDGLFAYQLAVVVDDADQGITDIVRGADLLDSTPRQILLQQALGLPTPRYAHLPVLLDAGGRKISKQDDAAPLAPQDPVGNLRRALRALGQAVPPADIDTATLLSLAKTQWQPARIPARMQLTCAEHAAG